jgi:membrane protease subunit HflC
MITTTVNKETTANYGIEIVDLRFKRIIYVESVLRSIYVQMQKERQKISSKIIAEGQSESSKTIGKTDQEVRTISSNGYRVAQEIRGKADARAANIYTKSYNKNNDTREFYAFLKTLEMYKKNLTKEDMLILSTKSEIFKYLKSSN